MRASFDSPGEQMTELNSDAKCQLRGRLKIFFGASVGVGKTYAMLESARGGRGGGRVGVGGGV
jgi:two-component system sensor histidine kinase KdpD